MDQERLTAERVHDARKIIKSLQATLRLTRGALAGEARNQASRDLARPLSGPRDATVTLAAFEKAYNESLNGDPSLKVEPRWATQLEHSLVDKAP